MAVECDACEQVQKLIDCGGSAGEEQARNIIIRVLCEMRTLLQQLVDEDS